MSFFGNGNILQNNLHIENSVLLNTPHKKGEKPEGLLQVPSTDTLTLFRNNSYRVGHYKAYKAK